MSGFASTILPGRGTAKSTFKLLVNLVTNDSSILSISTDSGLAEVSYQCQLIIYDECTMSHRGAMEDLGKTYRSSEAISNPWEGWALVLSGDFRYTLEVILRRTRSTKIKACIMSSYISNNVLEFSFNINVWYLLNGNECANVCPSWLLQLENWTVPFDGSVDISLVYITIIVNSPA